MIQITSNIPQKQLDDFKAELAKDEEWFSSEEGYGKDSQVVLQDILIDGVKIYRVCTCSIFGNDCTYFFSEDSARNYFYEMLFEKYVRLNPIVGRTAAKIAASLTADL